MSFFHTYIIPLFIGVSECMYELKFFLDPKTGYFSPILIMRSINTFLGFFCWDEIFFSKTFGSIETIITFVLLMDRSTEDTSTLLLN